MAAEREAGLSAQLAVAAARVRALEAAVAGRDAEVSELTGQARAYAAETAELRRELGLKSAAEEQVGVTIEIRGCGRTCLNIPAVLGVDVYKKCGMQCHRFFPS